jgi:hypothetical protein
MTIVPLYITQYLYLLTDIINQYQHGGRVELERNEIGNCNRFFLKNYFPTSVPNLAAHLTQRSLNMVQAYWPVGQQLKVTDRLRGLLLCMILRQDKLQACKPTAMHVSNQKPMFCKHD